MTPAQIFTTPIASPGKSAGPDTKAGDTSAFENLLTKPTSNKVISETKDSSEAVNQTEEQHAPAASDESPKTKETKIDTEFGFEKKLNPLTEKSSDDEDTTDDALDQKENSVALLNNDTQTLIEQADPDDPALVNVTQETPVNSNNLAQEVSRDPAPTDEVAMITTQTVQAKPRPTEDLEAEKSTELAEPASEDLDVEEVNTPISPKSLSMIGEFSSSNPLTVDPKYQDISSAAAPVLAKDNQVKPRQVRLDVKADEPAAKIVKLDPPTPAQVADRPTVTPPVMNEDQETVDNRSSAAMPVTMDDATEDSPLIKVADMTVKAADVTVKDVEMKPQQTETSVRQKAATVETTIKHEPSLSIKSIDATPESFRAIDAGSNEVRETTAPRQPPKSPIVQNVLGHVRQIAVEPGKTTIRLKPHGMGLVEFDVSADPDGRMEVSVRAKNPMVLEALRFERHAIADLLIQQGASIKSDSLSFEMFSEQGKDGSGDAKETGASDNGSGDAASDDDNTTGSAADIQNNAIQNSPTNILI